MTSRDDKDSMATGDRPKRGVPEGVWTQCPQCKATIFKKEADARLNVCPECDYHFYLPARQRIAQLLDEDSFEEWFTNLSPCDPLEFVVAKQSARNAALYGLTDRGTLAVGMRADVNVIDHAGLSVAPPVAHSDLPAGGTRLIQPVKGYVATMCNGVVTRRHDADTGARPGRLVRS